ncbi:MAG: hypothetical protein AAFU85_30660 [Planctomycetota bacterium]
MQDLREVTEELIGDLRALREGKITNADARTRAQLGREILRAVHLQLEGVKLIESKAKKVGIEQKDSAK